MSGQESTTWQRLEPHSRSSDFLKGVQATIHDPAWMLARQWQLGEFEGEDAGSPIHAKVTTRYGKISKLLIDKQQPSLGYDGNIPLEVCVERMRPEIFTQKADGNTTLELDLQTRVRLGLQFKREMETTLEAFANLPNFNVKELKGFLANQTELTFLLDDRQIEFEMNVTQDYLSAIRGRVIDIYKIYNTDGSILRTKAEEYCSNVGITAAESIGNGLVMAFKNLKEWWDGNNNSPDPSKREEPFFEKPSGSNNPAWKSRNLEYNFNVQIEGTDDNNKLILDASEYKEDHLDWYSFTVDDLSQEFTFQSTDTRTVIPTHLKFRGMAEKRWWNFEDSYIDFGAITPKTSNIATVLMMEFALVHSPDWYTIPYQMKEGMLSQIENLVVKDCFGDETQIEPAGLTSKERTIASNDPTWNSWSIFLLSRKYKTRGQQLNTSYFFLPPVLDHVISGPPLEEIKFIRDEVANLAWAIEKQYSTFYGEPISGYDHFFEQRNRSQKASWKNIPGIDSSKLKDFLKHNYKEDWIENLEFIKSDDEKAILVWLHGASSSGTTTTPLRSLSIKLDNKPSKATKATLMIDNIIADEFSIVQDNGEPNILMKRSQKSLKYTFMTDVPWNWIPFIPVHTTELVVSSSISDSYAHIELQRAAMLNSMTGKPVRPNSRLLSEVQPRYYIDESEVPRTGAVLSERYKRAVSSNGRIFLWIGRKKSIGAGEGSSGLKFDSIPINEKKV